MAIKKYRAKSIHDAVAMIKEECGSEAMILSTKKLSYADNNYNSEKMFEVAALVGHDVKNSYKQIPDQSLKDAGDDTSCLKNDKQKPSITIEDMLFFLNQTNSLPDIITSNSQSFSIYARLLKTGVSESLINYFIKQGSINASFNNHDIKDIPGRVINAIADIIKVKNIFNFSEGKKNIAAFIGPTGVGKTTTTAKLAAELSLKQNKKVGLICVDNYRVGAVEQLKTYAAIMGISCLAAFSKEDMGRALEKFEKKDVVLIDTAGQSPFDKKRMKELLYIFSEYDQISCHMVLSANTDKLDLRDIVDKFSILNPETYIFTKLDETIRRGVIIDQLADYNIPVSFLTNGQGVPDDIMKATKKRILKFIF